MKIHKIAKGEKLLGYALMNSETGVSFLSDNALLVCDTLDEIQKAAKYNTAPDYDIHEIGFNHTLFIMKNFGALYAFNKGSFIAFQKYLKDSFPNFEEQLSKIFSMNVEEDKLYIVCIKINNIDKDYEIILN